MIAAALRPGILLYLLALSIPFGSLRQLPIGPVNLSPTDVLIGLLLAAWLLRALSRRSVRLSWRGVALPLLAFLGAGLLSFAVTTSVRLSLIEWIKWAELLAVYLFVTQLRYEPTAERTIARTLPVFLVLAGIGEGLLGIYQFIRQVGPPAFVLMGRFVRAHGTFRQPNPYGGYMGLTLPIAIGLTVAYWPRKNSPATGSRRARWGLWLLSLAGCGVMGTALIMSWSRGAWLGFLAAVAVVCLRMGWRTVLVAVLVVAVGWGVAVAVVGVNPLRGPILDRFEQDGVPLGAAFGPTTDLQATEVTDDNWATLERLAHWHAAWLMWADSPWIGVGIGNYALAYVRYAVPRWQDPLGHAHNYYLQVAGETGAVGLTAYLILVVASLVLAWRTARPRPTAVARSCPGKTIRLAHVTDDRYWRGVALGTLGVLAHLSAHNVVDNLYVAGMYVQVGLVLGLAEIARRRMGVNHC